MKIINNCSHYCKTVRNLMPGDVFMYCNEPYMRVYNTPVDLKNDMCPIVNLHTGYSRVLIDPNEPVRMLDAELSIRYKIKEEE